MSKTHPASIKRGLGLISFGIIINFIAFIVLLILGLILKDQSDKLAKVQTICDVISLVASVSWIVGLILCLFSGEKHFKFALFAYIAVVIIEIVFAILKNKITDFPTAAIIAEVVLIALAHIAFLRALKDVGAENKFNSFLLFVCIVLYALAVGCLIYSSVKGEKAFISNSICYTLIAVENVLFLICILLTNKTLKV